MLNANQAKETAGQYIKHITGRQRHHLPGTASTADLSVISFEAVEALGHGWAGRTLLH